MLSKKLLEKITIIKEEIKMKKKWLKMGQTCQMYLMIEEIKLTCYLPVLWLKQCYSILHVLYTTITYTKIHILEAYISHATPQQKIINDVKK